MLEELRAGGTNAEIAVRLGISRDAVKYHISPGIYRSVSAGISHTCALEESGEVHCWGDNGYGQGDAPPGPYKSVSAGWTHTCGLRESGGIACWGAGLVPGARAPKDLQ